MDNTNQLEFIASLAFVKDFIGKFPKGEIYLVGGAVRDILLGIGSSDFDFVVENVSIDDLVKFLKKHGRVTEVAGRTFGTIKFAPKNNIPLLAPPSLGGEKNDSPPKIGGVRGGMNDIIVFDFALPRREKYAPGQRRKDAVIELENATIREDLARRDFTINAMAIDLRSVIAIPRSGEAICKTKDCRAPRLRAKGSPSGLEMTKDFLLDPFDGLSDLKNKLIRAVGNPTERFLEDPTRILRGIRFAVRFGFQIDPKTLQAMQALAPEIAKKFRDDRGREIERVSNEVIGQEFFKTYVIDPEKTIQLYDKTGLLRLLLPEVAEMKGVAQPPQFHSEGDVFIHTLLALGNLPKEAGLVVKLATLFHDAGKPLTFQSLEKTGDRIRFPSHDKVGAEIAHKVLKRLKLPNSLIDDVLWLVSHHMQVMTDFAKMRPEKQKRFALDRRIPQLLVLAEADSKASIAPDGNNCSKSLENAIEKILVVRKSAKAMPKEIISGDEIIAILSNKITNFDAKKQGRMIGNIKKFINSEYDKGKVKNRAEANELIRKWLKKK